jgi:hypothetical protein
LAGQYPRSASQYLARSAEQLPMEGADNSHRPAKTLVKLLCQQASASEPLPASLRPIRTSVRAAPTPAPSRASSPNASTIRTTSSTRTVRHMTRALRRRRRTNLLSIPSNKSTPAAPLRSSDLLDSNSRPTLARGGQRRGELPSTSRSAGCEKNVSSQKRNQGAPPVRLTERRTSAQLAARAPAALSDSGG